MLEGLLDCLVLGNAGIDRQSGDLASRVLLICAPTFIGRVSGLFIKRKVPDTTSSTHCARS